MYCDATYETRLKRLHANIYLHLKNPNLLLITFKHRTVVQGLFPGKMYLQRHDSDSK